MAEDGRTQGICQAAPGFPSLLINALESLGVLERPRYYSREYEHHGTLRCRVILVIAKMVVRKALYYLCRILEEHLVPTPMRIFPPAIRTPVWEARMRSLERRHHEEDPLYQVATYLSLLGSAL